MLFQWGLVRCRSWGTPVCLFPSRVCYSCPWATCSYARAITTPCPDHKHPRAGCRFVVHRPDWNHREGPGVCSDPRHKLTLWQRNFLSRRPHISHWKTNADAAAAASRHSSSPGNEAVFPAIYVTVYSRQQRRSIHNSSKLLSLKLPLPLYSCSPPLSVTPIAPSS